MVSTTGKEQTNIEFIKKKPEVYSKPCPKCNGWVGLYPKEECKECKGKGYVIIEYNN